MKLQKAIKINEKEIKELYLDKNKFTASVIIQSEKEFLMSGGIFPQGEMETSRDYLLTVASKILGYKTEDLMGLSGYDFIQLTNEVKGFFGGSALQDFIVKILEKQQ